MSSKKKTIRASKQRKKEKKQMTFTQFERMVTKKARKSGKPLFMDNAWWNNTHIEWYFHIGLGGNIRTAPNMTAHLTKKMAHLFSTAPKKFSPIEAIRLGQVMGLGGDKRLANHIADSILGRNLDNDEFWFTVVQFFVNNPMFDVTQISPIIDYIFFQKYGEGDRPTFCMKGRTPNSLMTEMELWHEQLQKVKKHRQHNWEHSSINDFEFVEKSGYSFKTWTITELLSSKDLQKEGTAMNHCVSSYSRSCAERHTSIWSLSLDGERKVTIEVSLRNEHRIYQVRGKYNRMPTTQELQIIKRWTSKEYILFN